MAIGEVFERFPYELIVDTGGRRSAKDGFAIDWARNLMIRSGQPQNAHTYARGSWGYTILRTVYSEESKVLFPKAIENLQRWVTKVYLHENRFPEWGENCFYKTDASVNEELARRFRIETVEDEAELNYPRIRDASLGEIRTLRAAFEKWVASVGEDIKDRRCPRLCDFLVIDDASMKTLAALPEETSPLQPAISWEQRQEWHWNGHAHVWFFDSYFIQEYVEGVTESAYRGWMQLEARCIPHIWSCRANRIEPEEWDATTMERVDEDNSVSYWWDEP